VTENRKLIKRFFNEVVNQGKLKVIDEIIHPDYVNYGFPIKAKGPEAMKAVMEIMSAGFPDLEITLDEVIEDGNTLATRGNWKGTHKGIFMNFPATGKLVNINYVDMWKVKDRRLWQNWVQMDFVGLLNQIGVLPH
jgi:predicted ester cyclase